MQSFDPNTVAKIIAQSREERWPYPKVFQTLKEAGVQSYETHIRDHSIVYRGADREYKEDAPHDNKIIHVTDEFRAEGIEKAFIHYQNKEIGYPQFLHDIAANGAYKYRVDMTDRTFTYIGKNPVDTYTKNIPE